ncbi:hypothetical protein KPL71_008693 [Citrus sinensis]|uniref:Uncharacterized protein n=1 Tax=Citrus sinensis TaxID=2711 RepID=A0ACB8M886_CITSI|nr:hypothetical protein KPL71_008693 [Citrus sinensis]
MLWGVRKYQSNPGRKYWNTIKRIIAYLKSTTHYSLCYQGGELRLIGYTDADWGGNLGERKSTFIYAFLLSHGAISWSSKKQTCIALSTIEVEYEAYLKIITDSSRPVIIYCDSQTAISFAKDAKYNSKSKHIETKYNFVRKNVVQREVLIQYTSTHFMIADPFTKAITRDVYLKHTRSLGLRRL